MDITKLAKEWAENYAEDMKAKDKIAIEDAVIYGFHICLELFNPKNNPIYDGVVKTWKKNMSEEQKNGYKEWHKVKQKYDYYRNPLYHENRLEKFRTHYRLVKENGKYVTKSRYILYSETDTKKFTNIKDVCKFLHIGETTARQFIKSGREINGWTIDYL